MTFGTECFRNSTNIVNIFQNLEDFTKKINVGSFENYCGLVNLRRVYVSIMELTLIEIFKINQI